MGGGNSKQSADLAQNCVYSKTDFQTRVQIIQNAHSMVQFYANLLLSEKMPLQLQEYRNYSDVAENYFNSKRKETNSDIQEINPKLRNYYDFFNALNNLQMEYEKPEITESDRRRKVRDIFDVSYVVLRLLVEELWESCDVQGRPPKASSTASSDASSQASSDASSQASSDASSQASSSN